MEPFDTIKASPQKGAMSFLALGHLGPVSGVQSVCIGTYVPLLVDDKV